MPEAEKGVQGKGAAALGPALAHSDAEREQRFGLKSDFRLASR